MAASIPPKLQEAGIAQFARRAAQVESVKPIIAYWLRYYMTQKIIGKGLHLADQDCTIYTTNLMEKLEQTKAEYPTEDALTDEMAAYAYCEQFALQTFAKGDDQIRQNKVTKATADTLLAATTFMELLSIWKEPPEAEIKSKMTYAKYHAVRIAKAVKNGEDPNLSNPKQETPITTPGPPDTTATGSPPNGQAEQKPYQPYVESAPATSGAASPTFSAPPMDIPSAPTGFPAATQSTFTQHPDVSPISQPATSRKGSEVSVGGGYFPRVDVPTFTSESAPSGHPTAPEIQDTTMADNFNPPAAPSPLAPPSQAPDPQSFYQPQASPNPFEHQQPPPQQPASNAPPVQPQFQQASAGFASPQPTQQPPVFQASPNPLLTAQPYHQQPPHTFEQQPPSAPQPFPQGTLKSDEDSIMEAQKHAKWAISALNFEDVTTAVKELQTALIALGAR